MGLFNRKPKEDKNSKFKEIKKEELDVELTEEDLEHVNGNMPKEEFDAYLRAKKEQEENIDNMLKR